MGHGGDPVEGDGAIPAGRRHIGATSEDRTGEDDSVMSDACCSMCQVGVVRTPIDPDEDILGLVKQLAVERRES